MMKKATLLVLISSMSLMAVFVAAHYQSIQCIQDAEDTTSPFLDQDDDTTQQQDDSTSGKDDSSDGGSNIRDTPILLDRGSSSSSTHTSSGSHSSSSGHTRGSIDFYLFMKNDMEQEVQTIQTEIGRTITTVLRLTYHGQSHLQMIYIEQYLPACLEYIPGSVQFLHAPSIETIIEEEQRLVWEFPDDNPILTDGKYLDISFKATVVPCDEGIYDSIAFAEAYDKNSESYTATAQGKIKVIVHQQPQTLILENFVKNDMSQDVQTLDVYSGSELTVLLRLTYKGGYSCKMVEVTNYLPDCLEFIPGSETFKNAPVVKTHIINQGKTLQWDFPDDDPTLTDGESIEISFKCTVTDASQGDYTNHASAIAWDRNSESMQAEDSVLLTLLR